MADRRKIVEGLWFAVPLRTTGFGVGVVARCNPKGVLLGYFFGPKRAAPPTLDEVAGLSPEAAVLVEKFGHLGIRDGKWPLVGVDSGWERRRWPMPVFIRYEELTGRSFLVYYDEDDPNRLVREEQIRPESAEQGPRDGLLGAGAAEKVLTGLLDST
ncbi:MAG: Imm26 family immunity protein [Acidimicrobiales bacterium]